MSPTSDILRIGGDRAAGARLFPGVLGAAVDPSTLDWTGGDLFDAGSISATAGDRLTSWSGSKGRRVATASATVDEQPVYRDGEPRVQFDGADEYLEVDSGFVSGSALTIHVITEGVETGSTQRLTYVNNAHIVTITAGGDVQASVRTSDDSYVNVSASGFEDWFLRHQIALTYDGSTVRLYLDGNLADTAAGTGVLAPRATIHSLASAAAFSQFCACEILHYAYATESYGAAKIRGLWNFFKVDLDAWVPADAGNVVEFFDAFDLEGVVSDGATVSSWAGDLGAHTLASVTGANDPTFYERTNGFPGVRFDGDNSEALQADSIAVEVAPLNTTVTMVITAAQSVTTVQHGWSFGNSGSGIPFQLFEHWNGGLGQAKVTTRQDDTTLDSITGSGGLLDEGLLTLQTDSGRDLTTFLYGTTEQAQGASLTGTVTVDRFTVAADRRSGSPGDFGYFTLRAMMVTDGPIARADLARLKRWHEARTAAALDAAPSSIAEVDYWFDATAPETVYQDSAKSISAYDETEPVKVWVDRVQGVDTISPTSATRPVMDFARGLRGLRFDKSDDALRSAARSLDYSEGISIFAVVRPETDANFQDVMMLTATAGDYLDSVAEVYAIASLSGSDLGRWLYNGNRRASFERLITGDLAGTAPEGQYVEVEITGAISGVLDAETDDASATQNTSTGSGNELRPAAITGSIGIGEVAGHMGGLICELIICRAGLSSADATAIRDYLKTKWRPIIGA